MFGWVKKLFKKEESLGIKAISRYEGGPVVLSSYGYSIPKRIARLKYRIYQLEQHVKKHTKEGNKKKVKHALKVITNKKALLTRLENIGQ